MPDPLIETFAKVLGIDAASLSDESSPENTPEWDSLRALALVVGIEERFSTSLTTREIMKMRSIGIAREVLRKKGVDI